MKKKYLKPEALVEVFEMERSVMLAASDSPATNDPALGREFDNQDFANEIIFIDMLQ